MSWFKKFFKKKDEQVSENHHVHKEIEHKKHEEAKKNSTDIIDMSELNKDLKSTKKTTKIKK